MKTLKTIAATMIALMTFGAQAGTVPVIGESSPIELIGLQSSISFSIGEPVTLPAGNYQLKVKALNGFYLKPLPIDVTSTVTMIDVTPEGEPLFSVVAVR